MNKLINILIVITIVVCVISTGLAFSSIDDDLRFTETGEVIRK